MDGIGNREEHERERVSRDIERKERNNVKTQNKGDQNEQTNKEKRKEQTINAKTTKKKHKKSNNNNKKEASG